MAIMILSPLQYLKRLKIRYRKKNILLIKTLDVFMRPPLKIAVTRAKKCVKQRIFIGLHYTENRYGYLIGLVSAETLP